MKCYLYSLRLRHKDDYTHTLLQNYLAKKHPDLKDCSIVKNKDGQPFLSVKENLFPLSISHKDTHVCIAFSKDNIYVGVDIEKISTKTLLLAKDFCEDEEIDDIERAENKEELAALYWSMKEAVGKAYGEGLLIHPKKTYFNRTTMTVQRKGVAIPAFLKTFTKEGYVTSFVAIHRK